MLTHGVTVDVTDVMQGVRMSCPRGVVESWEMHCTENQKQIFPESKLPGQVPNFYIHLSVSDSYILTIGPPILLYCVCGPIVGIYKSPTDT
jgi:hypothetical protein